MIYQAAPRKSLKGLVKNPDEGFWLEGKDYVIRDGDVVLFRFNV